MLSDTVHVLDAPLPKEVGEQAAPVNWTGATRVSVTDLTAVPDPAVRMATWSRLTCTAVALKLTELCPAGTVTLAGTIRFALLLETGTAYPPASAAEFKETVHDVLPGVFKVIIVQTIPLSVGWTETDTVMLPETPLAGIGFAAAVEAPAPVIWMGIIWAEGFAAIWKVAMATVPSGIMVPLSPLMRHKFPLHSKDF